MESIERDSPKQVIVMRRDLGMRRGKEIAQGAHASMIWLVTRIRQPGFSFTEAERRWLDGALSVRQRLHQPDGRPPGPVISDDLVVALGRPRLHRP